MIFGFGWVPHSIYSALGGLVGNKTHFKGSLLPTVGQSGNREQNHGRNGFTLRRTICEVKEICLGLRENILRSKENILRSRETIWGQGKLFLDQGKIF